MVKQTQTKAHALVEGYQPQTDKYFLRSRAILEAENVNPVVRYQMFARTDAPAIVGLDEAVNFVKGVAGDKVKVYALGDGMNYRAGEPMMKLEGRVQDLVDLETVYLSIVSGRMTEKYRGEIDMEEVRQKARDVVAAAAGKPVFYFGARHFAPELDEGIAKICQEEGFAGCSTDVGAKAWNAKGLGTVPHALVLAYNAVKLENGYTLNPTVEAMKAFDKNIDKAVPRVMLIDGFNQEIDDAVAVAKAVPSLKGVRIDTCGENFAQGSNDVKLPNLDVDKKYLEGTGVTIPAVWALRQGLDNAGFGELELTVSSGFNAKKTAAFIKADEAYREQFGKPLFDAVGTGSLASPIMTTSDIVAYKNEKTGKWMPNSKVGRNETESDRLEEVL